MTTTPLPPGVFNDPDTRLDRLWAWLRLADLGLTPRWQIEDEWHKVIRAEFRERYIKEPS